MTYPGRIAIVTHELYYGASQALRDYLVKKRVDTVLFISHPFHRQHRYSYWQVYRRGKLTNADKKYRFWHVGLLNYFLDEVYSFWWYARQRMKVDIYIGVDPLNCLVGLVLRKLGLVKRTVFYTIDFTPVRFGNGWLDTMYHTIERWCVIYADELWDVSPRIMKGRSKFLKMEKEDYLVKQKLVPIGVWRKDIHYRKLTDQGRFTIVFAGHLLEKQGVQKLIEALPLAIKKIPEVRLLVVGGGEYENELKALSKRLSVSGKVEFTGWIKNQNKIRKLLAGCAVAMAPYDPAKEDSTNFTYYADPTKIKIYLSCGLPVVMTAVPYNAGELARYGCAVIVDYDEKSIAKALIDLLTDKEKLEKMRKSTIKIAKEFTWEKIFEHVII